RQAFGSGSGAPTEAAAAVGRREPPAEAVESPAEAAVEPSAVGGRRQRHDRLITTSPATAPPAAGIPAPAEPGVQAQPQLQGTPPLQLQEQQPAAPLLEGQVEAKPGVERLRGEAATEAVAVVGGVGVAIPGQRVEAAEVTPAAAKPAVEGEV